MGGHPGHGGPGGHQGHPGHGGPPRVVAPPCPCRHPRHPRADPGTRHHRHRGLRPRQRGDTAGTARGHQGDSRGHQGDSRGQGASAAGVTGGQPRDSEGVVPVPPVVSPASWHRRGAGCHLWGGHEETVSPTGPSVPNRTRPGLFVPLAANKRRESRPCSLALALLALMKVPVGGAALAPPDSPKMGRLNVVLFICSQPELQQQRKQTPGGRGTAGLGAPWLGGAPWVWGTLAGWGGL